MFQAAEYLDARSLTKKIFDCQDDLGLDYKQSYDGASVMSGKNSGVAARIQEDCKQAVYVHCYAHKLNLVLVDVTKSVTEAGYFFSLLQKLYVFISDSYVHNKWKIVQKEMYPTEQQFQLQRLNDTHWACRYYACHAVLCRLPTIIRVIDEVINESHSNRAVEARGIRGQIDFKFMLMLSTFDAILGKTRLASKMLQSSGLDLARAMDVVKVLKDRMHEMRLSYSHEMRMHVMRTKFASIWHKSKELSKTCHIISENQQCFSRGRRVERSLPSALQDYVVETPMLERSGGDEDVVKFEIVFPILDEMNADLKRRFSEFSCNILRGIQSLCPAGDSFLQLSHMKSLAETYDANMDDLVHEVPQAKRLIERKVKKGVAKLTTLTQFLLFIYPYKEAFHELFRLYKIAVTIPATSASAERSFSALKGIKTYLRSTMTHNRISNLDVLSIERRRSGHLDVEEFVDIFLRYTTTEELSFSKQ